jgi:Flp pilus assembly pilin Flp
MSGGLPRALPRRLARDRRGATIIEFALLLPVMLLMLFSLFDLCFQVYVQSVLTGAVQRAGRDLTLEGGTPASIDAIHARVEDMVQAVMPQATVRHEQKSYSSFSTMAPERFIDANNNHIRDPGECFDDVNRNGIWDSDPAISTIGGPNDITVYTARVTYSQPFPLIPIGNFLSNDVALSSTTVFKNQPFGTQTVSPVQQICS